MTTIQQVGGPDRPGPAVDAGVEQKGEVKSAPAAVTVAIPPPAPVATTPVVPVTPYTGGVGANGRRNATLVILGLANAGKSTVGNNIKGKPADYVFPTMGFDLDEDIVQANFNVKCVVHVWREVDRGFLWC